MKQIMLEMKRDFWRRGPFYRFYKSEVFRWFISMIVLLAAGMTITTAGHKLDISWLQNLGSSLAFVGFAGTDLTFIGFAFYDIFGRLFKNEF